MIKVGKRRFLLASYNDNRCQSNLQASGSFTLFSRSAKQMKSMIENRFVSVSSEPKWLGSAYVCGDTIIAEVMLGLSGKRVFADVYRTTPQSKCFFNDEEARSFIEKYIGAKNDRRRNSNAIHANT